MKRFTISFITLCLCFSQDGLKVDIYKLDNGLTVYLNEDHNETSVFGAVVVDGGGKVDPSDATGIAHYLEHMLFKGTQEMGTIDFESEKVYLDSIRIKYDELAVTENSEARLEIQKEINRLNLKASEYAIPNEFNRLAEMMGGTWINAYTSNDQIVYMNKFPGNQIEKWIDLYRARFENPVFRLFQSELETVYEEKNRSADNFFGNLFEEFLSNFFKNHPYGQQTILGSIEHLKSPSLTKMQEYYDKYYIANNMALVLCGDFNIEEVKPIIAEKFGTFRSGVLPEPLGISEDAFNGREFIKKRLTPMKVGVVGFRGVSANHPDELALDFVQQMLSNKYKTGLLDKLSTDGKILGAGAFPMSFVDHGALMFFFMPKIPFQGLKKVEKLVLAEANKIKSGEFDEKLVDMIKLGMNRDYQQRLENMQNRLFLFVNAHTNKQSWSQIKSYPDMVDAITKEDIVRVANKYLGDDYLAMYSKTGFPKKEKLDKPPYEPVIPKNTESLSSYAREHLKIKTKEAPIQFIEFNKDVRMSSINQMVDFYYTMNPTNDIFSLTYSFCIGSQEEPILSQATEYINNIGTNSKSFDQFREELQFIGATIDASVSSDFFRFNIKGFDKYLDETVELANEFFNGMSGDDEKLKLLEQTSKLNRKTESEDPGTVGRALLQYAMYGKESSYLDRLSASDIKSLKSEELINAVKDAMTHKLDIFYTGRIPMNSVKSIISNHSDLSLIKNQSKSMIYKPHNPFTENAVYVIDDDKAIQAQIYFAFDGSDAKEEDRAMADAFNNYFSGGMGSIVFQEIREFRSLAYSAGAWYDFPDINGNKGSFQAYIGTQADKTIDAIETYLDLAQNMPEKPERLEQIRSALVQSINAKRPPFRRYNNWVSWWTKMGYNDDPRKKKVAEFNAMDFNDIISFYNNSVDASIYSIVIVADLSRVDMDKLGEFGKIIKLNKSDVFN